MFSKNVLNGLPPIKGIKHQIDLMLKYVIPNHRVYRSNHNETKELQMQVKKLMSKRHIKESMSSCVILVLLVLNKMDFRGCVLITKLSRTLW